MSMLCFYLCTISASYFIGLVVGLYDKHQNTPAPKYYPYYDKPTRLEILKKRLP